MATRKEIMEADGFTMVGHGGGRPRKSPAKAGSASPSSSPTASPIRPSGSSVKAAMKSNNASKIKKSIEAIEHMGYGAVCSDSVIGVELADDLLIVCLFRLQFENNGVNAALQKTFLEAKLSTPQRVVALGLGSLSSSTISQYQFAFLLAIRQIFGVTVVDAYDPVFDEVDAAIIKHFECSQIPNNSSGKFSSDDLTIYYMPHCPLGLYGNLLMSNWEPTKLNNTVIVGNSFSNYDARRSSSTRDKQSSEEFVFRANNYLLELNLTFADEAFANAFSDQFLHVWKELPGPSSDFWQREGATESRSLEVINSALQQLTL